MDVLSSVRPDTPLGLGLIALMVASFLFAPLAIFLLATYAFGLAVSVGIVKAVELYFGRTQPVTSRPAA